MSYKISNKKLISDIEPIVKKKLDDYFEKRNLLKIRSLKTIEIIQRSFSIIIIYEIEQQNQKQKFVLKKIVHDPINIKITKKENQAVVEFNLLKKIYPEFENIEGCSVPKPIIVLPEIEAFLMEFVEGEIFSEKMGNSKFLVSNSKFDELKKIFFLSGKFLREFQRITSVEKSECYSYNWLVEKCLDRIELIKRIDNYNKFPKELKNRVIDSIYSQVEILKTKKIKIAGKHADFGHWNIMVTPKGIFVFDFMGYSKETILYDLMKMIFSLNYWKNHFAYNNKKLIILENCLLDGYGGFPSVSESEKTICELYFRIETIYACLSNPGRRIDMKLMKYFVIKNNIKSLEKILRGNIYFKTKMGI